MHWKRVLTRSNHSTWLDHLRTPRIGIILVRCTWLLFAVGSGWILALGSPLQWALYQRICHTHICNPFAQLNTESAQAVLGLGIPLDLYATTISGIDWIWVLCWWALGLVLIWHRPRDPVALLLALISVSMTASLYAQRLSPVLPSYILHGLTFLQDITFCWLFAIFPNGRFVPRWSRISTLVLTGYFVVLDLVLVPLFAESPLEFKDVLGIPLLIYALSIQIYRYWRVSNEQERRQALWLVLGNVGLAFNVAVATMLETLGQVGIWLLPLIVVCNTAAVLLPLAIGIAVLRYRLFAIDVILNRALVYGGLTASVIGGYALVVGALGTLIQARGSFLVSLIGAGIVAILFQPLRVVLQRAANRLFYGARDDPYGVLVRLGGRLEATLAPEAVLPTIVETVRQTLKLPYAAITLGDLCQGDGTYATAGTAQGPLTALPLMYQGASIGQLLVSPRTGEKDVSSTDLRLLADLARQAGIAAHAFLLTQEVQRSREQLVTAREEERRRLRRDLHDGLGPALATITLQADTARSILHDDPSEAEALLGEVTTQAQTTMQDVRRLIHALRPPILDDLGLIAALRALASSLSTAGLTIMITAPDSLPTFPAAIEVAVYRIVQEALTNVVKHAHAHTCVITLESSEQVRVIIRDDGIGIAGDRAAGVGLASLRERAEELGGTCRVLPEQERGTRVEAYLPVRNTYGSNSHLDR